MHSTVGGAAARRRLDTASPAVRYAAVRALTVALVAPLSDADATVQSMEDASPAKWHLAHTTWFFETFILRGLAGYRLFDECYPFLFNSYYEAEGPRLARGRRGMLARPSLAEVFAYRAHVDEAMARLLDSVDAPADLLDLGLAHEQQHQELLITDIKHAAWSNPLGPAIFQQGPVIAAAASARDRGWLSHPGGIVAVGNDGRGFAFDCEGPPHDVLLPPFALASHPVSNGDWVQFIADGGYATPSLWLSEGWDWVRSEKVTSPLYWREDTQGWERFTLSGWRPLDLTAPVSHVSQYEADAFAAWAGARLPTEFEWEAVASGQDAAVGVQLDKAEAVDPRFDPGFFGNVWQWTRSAYLPYPGFRPVVGAVGEYNGKFMSGQAVLRGASCATPRGHSRSTYRNFFHPHQRWQFAGLRLARDS